MRPKIPGRLTLILVLAAVLRVGAWWLVLPTEPILDESDYMGRATRVVHGADISRESARPPGSIWYYAAALRLFGERHEVARAANVLVSVLLPLFVWMIGRKIAGERTAWIAALVVAVYPDAVLYACGLWSEPLYHAQSLGAVLLILGAELDPGRRLLKLAAAGLLLGIASLTREVGAPLALFSGIWLVLRAGVRSRRGWIGAAVLGTACFLTILPWSIRQSQARGYPVLITTTNWQNLYFGNVPLEADPASKGPHRPIITPNFQGYHALGDGPDERAAAAKPIIKKAILDRMPWWPFEKVLEMLPRIVSPNSLPTARMLGRPDEAGWSGRFSYRTQLDGTRWEGLRDWIAYANVACWAVILLGGTAGLGLARGPGFGLLLLFVAAHLLPQFVTHGQSRYRMPMVPILALGLGVLLAQGAARWREASLARRVVTGASVAFVGWAAGSFWWTITSPQWG